MNSATEAKQVAHTPGRRVPWNAGTSRGWIDDRGYRWLYVSENGRRVARREHRVIMERHLGRKLEPWELVHHKDENPQNNSIDNLELRDFGSHTADHSRGRRKDAEARRSMEAFALMREELKRERALRSDLLEALRVAADAIRSFDGGDPSTHSGWKHDELCDAWMQARSALTKASAS